MPSNNMNYEELASIGFYPSCYEPYPPFYQLCVKGCENFNKKMQTTKDMNKRARCAECIVRNKFAKC